MIILIFFLLGLCITTICSEFDEHKSSIIPQQQKQTLRTLFQKQYTHNKNISITPLHGGMSCDTKFIIKTDEKTYAAKIFDNASPHRHHEMYAHLLATEKGLAPHVYFHNHELMIMDFIEGHTLHCEEAQEPHVLMALANAAKRISEIDASCAYKDVFGAIKQNFALVITTQEPLHTNLAQAKDTIITLERIIQAQNKPLVFCHGDLNPRNIFFTNNKVIFIDWSDGGMSYPFFDIAGISVFCCLNKDNDEYLLTHYLQKKPTEQERHYFQCIKNIVYIHDALNLLVYLQDLNYPFTHDAPIKDFYQLETLWAKESSSNDPECTYALAYCQLHNFLNNTQQL